MNNAFMLYAMEQEGDIDTPLGRFNKMKKYLALGYKLEMAAQMAKVNLNSLSGSQLEEIKKYD